LSALTDEEERSVRVFNLHKGVVVGAAAICLLLWGIPCFTQQRPLVIAFAAPHDTSATCTANGGTNACIDNFVQYVLPNISGIGVTVPWGQIDVCGTPAGSTQCTISPDDDTHCGATTFTSYDWCTLDALLSYYISNYGTSFAGKKIALIITAVEDTSPNNPTPATTVTPPYVFSTGYASGLGANPQDIVVCSGWKGDISATSCPAYQNTGSFTSSDYAIWNINGAGPPLGCFATNPHLKCQTSACASPDYSGFPVVYEQPFMTAYQQFITALVHHYGPSSASAMGKVIGPYIAYVRIGLAAGGENQPYCSVGGIPIAAQTFWNNNLSVPNAGFLVNNNNTEFVSTGGGTTDASKPMPNCAPGCTTAADGSVPGWYNAGPWTPSTSSGNFVISPGPNGQFGSSPQAGDFSDNGYLTQWHIGLSTTPGYVESMVTFLRGIGAPFPLTINTHNGIPLGAPGVHGNVGYADSEAMVASANGVGFGMESVSVLDSKTFASFSAAQPLYAGGGTFPTSAADWAHNFTTYPAPIHYLQTYFPGDLYHAAGFPISGGIAVTTDLAGNIIATVTCASDCSSFTAAGTLGNPIFITGNENAGLNGVWQTCPNPDLTFSCVYTTTTLQFVLPSSMSGASGNTYMGGTVWAADYWPVIMPFALLHGANVIEVYECDLDYAFGLYGISATTTSWVSGTSGASGCLIHDPVSGSPVDGPETAYENLLPSTILGLPIYTSAFEGKSGLSGNAIRY
jgi:hypothetical protein